MSHHHEEEEDRANNQELALTQIQHVAHDGVLMIEASKRGDGHKPNCGEYIAALEAKVERIANIAEVGEPDEDFRAEVETESWELLTVDHVESGLLVDLDNEGKREGEPREVSGTSRSGTTVYLEFNDDQPGAQFAADELVWIRDWSGPR